MNAKVKQNLRSRYFKSIPLTFYPIPFIFFVFYLCTLILPGNNLVYWLPVGGIVIVSLINSLLTNIFHINPLQKYSRLFPDDYRTDYSAETLYNKLNRAAKEIFTDAEKPFQQVEYYILPEKSFRPRREDYAFFATKKNGRIMLFVPEYHVRSLEYEDLKGVLAHELSHVIQEIWITKTINRTIAVIGSWSVITFSVCIGIAFAWWWAIPIYYLLSIPAMHFIHSPTRFNETTADYFATVLGHGQGLINYLTMVDNSGFYKSLGSNWFMDHVMDHPSNSTRIKNILENIHF